MASLGRLREVVLDTSGNAISSAAVEVRRQGATVVSGSGTTPLTVTVNNPGGIVAGDTVVINTGTTSYDVDSVTATTVVLSGFLLTLTLSDEDRISPTNNLVALKNDAEAGESKSNPLTTDATGTATAWVIGNAYDLHISGGTATTTLVQDRIVDGDSSSTNHFGNSSSFAYRVDTTRYVGGTTNIRLWTLYDKSFPILKFGSDSTNNNTTNTMSGDVHRFGEAWLWSAGADAAPYKTWDVSDQALVTFRVHLEDGGSFEQYNFSTRTNFLGDFTKGQVGVIHETQWHSVDGDAAAGAASNVIGEQSVARVSGTTAGGTQATLTNIIGLAGSVKVTNGAAGTITSGVAVQAAGPHKVNGDGGSFVGTMTRGTALQCNTGQAAQINHAILIDFGGGIQTLSSGNNKLSNNPGITNTFIHYNFTTQFDGALTSAAGHTAMNYRHFNISPTLNWTLGSGGAFGTVMTALYVIPTWISAATLPVLTGIKVTLRNTTGGGTITTGYGIEITMPSIADGGTNTRFAGLRILKPDTSLATNPFHMLLEPLETATPKTTLDALTAIRGDFIFVRDTGDDANSGLAFFDGTTWIHCTAGGCAAISDT